MPAAILSTAPVSPRATERGEIEALNEWLKSYFNGQPHRSPLGDATWPACELLFNQAEMSEAQDGRPQIHTIIRTDSKQETWFAGSDLSDWEITLETPASGVSYGYAHGRIEESVHGKLARRLDGLNIRWQSNGSGDFVEQVFDGSTWSTVRTFPGASALRWIRESGNYLEQVSVGGTWTTQRTVAPVNSVWDGSKILVRASLTFSIYVRVFSNGAQDDAGDHLCRGVADNLKELFESEARHALGQKGLRHVKVRSGPTAMQGAGMQIRLLVVSAQASYYVPRSF